jgi:hypothetical protein
MTVGYEQAYRRVLRQTGQPRPSDLTTLTESRLLELGPDR